MKNILLATVLTLSSFAGTIAWASDADDLAYYQQFIFEETINDTDPENILISTRYLMSQWDAKTKLPNGDDLNVTAHILLFADYKFAIVYKENIFKANPPGAFFPGACREIQGTWSVQNGHLMLPGFGYLDRAVWEGQNAVSMTITEVIATEQAKGFNSTAAFGFSNIPRDQAMKCFAF